MPRVVLVRHGRAAAGFSDDVDPGLDDLGRAQAEEVADQLVAAGPRPVYVSPLRRTRETAAPLVARWGIEPVIEPSVAEIPSGDLDLTARGEWLRGVLSARWSELDPDLREWRDRVVRTVAGVTEDAVFFTHFIAINAVVGHAVDDDRVVVVTPGNGSCTVLDVSDGEVRVVQEGESTPSEVL